MILNRTIEIVPWVFVIYAGHKGAFVCFSVVFALCIIKEQFIQTHTVHVLSCVVAARGCGTIGALTIIFLLIIYRCVMLVHSCPQDICHYMCVRVWHVDTRECVLLCVHYQKDQEILASLGCNHFPIICYS